MKKKSIITVLVPALLMTLITVVSFINMSNNQYDAQLKGIFVLSLVVFFPLLFLIQGIICASSNINVFLALGVSILSFIILLMIYLNSSAFIYILIYLVFGIIGYLITNFIVKVKSSKK